MDTAQRALIEAIHRLAISESGFVFDPTSGQSYTVNPTALAMLRNLQQTQNLEQTVVFAQGKYDGDDREIERDLEDFFAQLSEQLGIV